MSGPNFFTELKRRNVYKVAIAYAVVAWVLIQAASILFPTFEAPGWVMKVFVALVAAGFPIALLIAWAFEMTPAGLKRTDAISSDEVAQLPYWSRRKFAAFVITLALLGLGLLVFQFLKPRPVSVATTAAEAIAKSIAVLPFENFNRDPENAYFADGIQDEILTRLAKIDDLKVISRTSTQRYKSSPENLPEIARQLGVAHVLEGSVQKAGDQVRVTVQLIRAATDSHIWAETYDRKLTDIFAVETEIAENIAKALRAKLTPGEQRVVAAKPTDNPEAYDAFLRGLAAWNDLNETPETLQTMAAACARAVQLDPKFAVAWAHLSLAQTTIYAEFEPTPQRLAEAKRALDEATRLQPDLGEAYFALGLYRYRGLHDYEGALQAFQRALERGVNRAMSIEFSGYVRRRQGRWDEAVALLEEAAKLDPLNAIIQSERATTLGCLRRYADARAALDHALSISPESVVLLGQKAGFYQREGNFEAAQPLIDRVPLDPQQPRSVLLRATQWFCTGRHAEAATALEQLLTRAGSVPTQLAATYRARLGFAKKLIGDDEGAVREWTRARAEFETLRQQSETGDAFIDELIVISGQLGDKAAVDALAEKADTQIHTDAFFGSVLEGAVAAARAQLGDKDAAIAQLRRLLSRPGDSSVTPATLRAHPVWDSLRGDPGFEELAQTKR